MQVVNWTCMFILQWCVCTYRNKINDRTIETLDKRQINVNILEPQRIQKVIHVHVYT